MASIHEINCRKKIRYATTEAAVRAIKRMEKRMGPAKRGQKRGAIRRVKLDYYQCRVCGAYHLTKNRW